MNVHLKPFYALLATLPLTVGTLTASAVVFEPVADTTTRSLFPITPVGDAGFLAVHSSVGNVQYTLLQFDLGSIPSDATIDSAILSLTANKALGNNLGNPTGQAMEVYRVTQAWTEAGATWLDSGSGPWSNPGGTHVGTTGVPGVSPYASNNQIVPSVYTTQTLTWDVTSLVAEWVSGAQPNLGLLIRSFDGNDLHFNSRDGADPGPSLDVSFTPIPEPVHVGLLSGLALIGFAGYRRYSRSAR
jgi:hypothetical protein